MAEDPSSGADLGQQQEAVYQQLRNLHDQLSEGPLTGRKVLIPFGPKAFFAGELRPALPSGQEEKGDELVYYRLPNPNNKDDKNELREMSRKDALLHLEEEMRQCTGSTVPATADANMTLIGPVPVSLPTTDGNHVVNTPPTTPLVDLPFFDIREEINDAGEEISAEAIDVSKHLDYLQRAASGGGESSDPGGMGDPSSVRHPTSKPSNPQVPTESNTQSDGSCDESTGEAAPSLAEQQYALLTARLDELARLEEEADKQNAVNQARSQKLESKGWNKGFLNKKKNSGAAGKAVVSESRSVAVESKVEESTKPSSKGKTVAFSESHQVREIPRVGQNPVPAKKPSLAPANLIEKSVLSDTVRERLPSKEVDEKALPPEKKKLSKFAQERLNRS